MGGQCLSLPSHGFSSFSLCNKKASLTDWKAGMCWWWLFILSDGHKCFRSLSAISWKLLDTGVLWLWGQRGWNWMNYGLLLCVFMFPICLLPLPPPLLPSIPSPSPVSECQSCTGLNEDPETGGLTGWLSGTRTRLLNGRHGFDPWSERSPGGVNGNPLQYSCLENCMDRGA